MDPNRFAEWSDVNWHAIGKLQPGDTRAREEAFLNHLDMDPRLLPTVVAPEKARQQAQEEAKAIWSNWRTFGQCWSQHRGTIVYTWQKLSLFERKMMLKKAWGQELPDVHNPDLELLIRKAKIIERGKVTMQAGGPAEVLDWRLSFLTPYINNQDLAEDANNLLFLLHSRAMNSPVSFWREDLKSQYTGRQTHLLVGTFRPFFAQSFLQEDGYGQLVPFSPLPDDHIMLKVLRQEVVLVGDGFLILEAQHKLLQFLTNITQLLIHAKKAPWSGSEVAPLLRNLERDTASCTTSLTTLALKDCYIKSWALPINSMLSVSEAFSNESENCLQELRQDPELFRTTILETLDHH